MCGAGSGPARCISIATPFVRQTYLTERVTRMLRFALVFAILALIAGVLGFGNLAGDFGYIARILLFVFLVLFVVSLILGRGRAPIA
jgi:uncharacterized membrane protein YtjA (UPF0391 family)